MSQEIGERSTHTGDAFVDFAYDLLAYALPILGCDWVAPPEFKRSTKKVFKDSFGDAIILYRARHAEEFEEGLRRYLAIENGEEGVSYLQQFCKRTFKGNIPLMEFIVYCAFLLNISICYSELGDLEEVHRLADETFGVFYNYVEIYFTIVGGWHALYRVAEQYVDFVKFPSPRICLNQVQKPWKNQN
ncbi:hypothetical protein HNY73_014981 [Argiope bruennichi]|uniref:Uncharacterized protein n=1 Tax=Argiope bruennichi TaxID=94029 RepID=A0A8T0ER09_ARGBR|nr:hypothetical protein HNY73_014981 [Argiope bruennichi]